MTKSPVSSCGVYCGLCLPRRTLATSLARRPRGLPVASTTHQARDEEACSFVITRVLWGEGLRVATSAWGAMEREPYLSAAEGRGKLRGGPRSVKAGSLPPKPLRGMDGR